MPGFFALSIEERRTYLQNVCPKLSGENLRTLDQSLSLHEADLMSENVVGTFSLPFSVAANFMIDGKSVLVPMVTEEPSIVAASSKMAKIVASVGGFNTKINAPLQKGQVQLFELADIDKALQLFIEHQEEIIHELNQLCPNMLRRGGGVVRIESRVLSSAKLGPILLIEPLVNVVDAMGANIVNHLMEALGEKLKELIGGTVVLRILSNLCDERLAHAQCRIPVQLLSTDKTHDFGEYIAKKMIAAHTLAEIDPYRACTHNKGIMNGIDAVALATGNDFRALEAGAHAYAARSGTYQALTSITFEQNNKNLLATLTIPLAIGVVGGICRTHRGVKVAHKLLGDYALNSTKLSSVMVSVGLAQCLAALLALSSDGIQKGHMKLHNKKSQF